MHAWRTKKPAAQSRPPAGAPPRRGRLARALGDAEHDAQLQLPHQVPAVVPPVYCLPGPWRLALPLHRMMTGPLHIINNKAWAQSAGKTFTQASFPDNLVIGIKVQTRLVIGHSLGDPPG